jgi:diacylglycerol kinase (ATP)
MAGTDAWGDAVDDVFPNKQSFSDGLIEVVTVSSVFHLGQLQAGANTGLRIAQCKSVEIEFNIEKNDDGTIKHDVELPVQADGEPWKVKNAKIQIGYHGPSRIIVRQ